ncbi:MAG: prepilin-type N-terminal cleavage/methylation domain-containing protein [Gemmatimonadetes bacterium]|nr:prepilin-type N-terminal cleavage/methylation domain-containing protein [Gemmatimonadota bacterium]MBL0179338.1 prepilin-type N-terminal cleavage/methylation domain-containing protein [Gemmatimonadota bacterium]
MTRRGVTLIELLLVLCLLGIVGVTVTAMVLGASRVAARATAHLAAERTAVVSASFLRHTLADGVWRDVTVAVDSIGLGRPVGEAALCAASGAQLWLRRSSWSGDRAPDPTRDQLRSWPDSGTAAVDEAIMGVTGDLCPDGAPAWRLLRGTGAAVGWWVRVVEPTTVRRYRVGSSEWLGLSDGGAPVQPFAGPLVAGASRFARIGGALQVDLVTVAGSSGLSLPLGSRP